LGDVPVRISCRKSEPGYVEWLRGGGFGAWRVYLDGVEQRDVIAADDSTGCVEVMRRDRDGNFVLNDEKKEVVRDVLRGKVELRAVVS
jgi:hypothetical protein